MDSDRQMKPHPPQAVPLPPLGKAEYPCDNCDYKRMLMRTSDVHFFGDDCPIECKKYNAWKKKNKLQGSRASVVIIDEWLCVDERKEKKNGKCE